MQIGGIGDQFAGTRRGELDMWDNVFDKIRPVQ